LGTIQNIIVNYTVHVEANENDELIWFVQNCARIHKVGCLNLEIIKKRNFKVSDILLFNGYEIEDCEKIDKIFRECIKEVIE